MASAAAPFIQIRCPGCGRSGRMGLQAEAPGVWECGRCREKIPLPAASGATGGTAPAICRICGSPHLYWQKDFNQKLGCSLVAAGAILTPWTYGLSLAVLALADLGMYALLPKISVCYVCGARYKGMPPNPSHHPFELQTAQTYEARSHHWASGTRRPAFTPDEAASSGAAE